MSSKQNVSRVLLDTSFIMPILGFNNEASVMQGLQKLQEMDIDIYYSELNLLEASFQAIQKIKNQKFNWKRYRNGLLSITAGGVFRLLASSDTDVYSTALKIYQLGHTDMFDNLLYALSLHNNVNFLTLDKNLRKFINLQKLPDTMLFVNQL